MANKKTTLAKTRLIKVQFEAEKQMKAMQESAEKRATELQKLIEEAEAAAIRAEEEEKQLLADTQSGIEKLAKGNGYFCGVILTKDDILAIVSLAIEVKENIKIPFRLYNIEDEPIKDKQPEVKPEVKPETKTEELT